MACNNIPEECKLDLWAKVIVAKNIQNDEPILGSFDPYGEPVGESVVVTVASNENIICLEDFKVTFDQDQVTEDFICTSKVVLTIPFNFFLFLKTNLGYVTATTTKTFVKEIPVNEFIKLDGTPLTQSEFKYQVDQSKVVVCNYELVDIDIVAKASPTATVQTINLVITATIVDKLGKYRDVIVYGYLEDLGCRD
ncbi:MAG: hypothetical protein AB9836_09705 [Aminipila sp.]